MTDLQQQLFTLRDESYAQFQSKLTPTVSPELFVGVRTPVLRNFAKQYIQNPEHKEFLQVLPHKYFDENMLHGMIISLSKDYEHCLHETYRFLPYIDNWAVCDTMSPKIFKKKRADLLRHIKTWSSSSHIYTCRFGIGMLMGHFLDSDFQPKLLEIPAGIQREEYYVNMMIAWFFATALAKQWDDTIPYIENRTLSPWTHNKTIQKARESYRISPSQKEYLKTLKI